MSSERVLVGHGSGGRLSQELFTRHFQPMLTNPVLDEMLDAAVIGEMALTTDSYVVTPRFFPGGDIGRLAVSGTVNDLAMVGARPLGIAAAFILEEGLPLDELDRIVASMASCAREAEVSIVAGDTKVVSRGGCDGIFITTSGVGVVSPDFRPAPKSVQPGDAIIVSGTIADHGMAVMACRPGIHLTGALESDVAPLSGLVEALRTSGIEVHALRDPTRGGVAQSLLEIAEAAGVRMRVDERSLPVEPPVVAACELLGLDPLYVANEGKLLCFVPETQATRALEVLRREPRGARAVRIGVVEAGSPAVELVTHLGARRSLRMASGELLPRIC
jgi:hydrogenase expression/formation protein HypE